MTENPYITLPRSRKADPEMLLLQPMRTQTTDTGDSLITHRNVSEIALVKFQTTQRVRVTV